MSGRPMEIQWVEIISVRLADTADADKVRRVFKELLDSLAGDIPPSFSAVLFKSGFVRTDWSIHLAWFEKRAELESSPLGTYLSRSLRTLGIVNHSIWEKDA